MKLPVLFSQRMVADSGSYSPSAGKPAALVALWLAGGGPEVELVLPEPATEAQIRAVHDPDYVDGVLSGRLSNGHGNRRSDVALSLPWTCGSMLSAARHALAHPAGPAPCSPSSGFHHACYDRGGGFCTLNGLMVAAAALVADGSARRVGVLDADMHYGNGTDDVMKRLRGRGVAPAASWLRHVTFGATHGPDRGPDRAPRAWHFLNVELPEVVAVMAGSCDVVLYQAGADPHVDDPLGGWLTTDELAERDRVVFEGCRRAGTPVAWNLAGGYQKDFSEVLRVHTNTARAAVRAAGGEA